MAADSYKYKIFCKDQLISDGAKQTRTLWERVFGLLGKPKLKSHEALIMSPCFLIDTFFMKYAIDVAFLNRKQKIVALYPNLKPYRMTCIHVTACKAVEWPAGTIEKWHLKKGMALKIEETHV